MDKLDEHRLIAAAKRGGQEGRAAYDELVRRHQRQVIRLTTHLLGPALAEDVAQDAFVRAYLKLASCPDDVTFAAWIRVIATRLSSNQRRDGAVRRTYESRTDTPDAPTDVSDERQILERALASLTYEHREVIVLRHIEEMPLDEIAQLLGIGKSAVKMRLSRAREELSKRYDILTRDR